MDNKIILLDMDGVVVHRDQVFSIRFSKKYNIPLEKVLLFFKGDFQRCLTGEKDLKTEIPKFFKKWNYEGTLDELLQFWFEGEREINQELLKVVKDARNKGVSVYLATNNEKYRTEYLCEVVGLKNYFDGIYSSAMLGVKKPDTVFYETLLKKIQCINPRNVYFCDDDEENIDGAQKAGLNIHFYKDNKEFEKWVQNLTDK
jgi:putative hydrolase of the HAD superfamily